MMKKVICAALSVTLAMMCSCGSAPTAPTSPNVTLAATKGREAATEALSLPKGSMQQEKALLRIRATEHRIRTAGDSAAADAYAAAAEAVLVTCKDIR